MKNTYFNMGQALKEKGDIKGALECFEKTQNPVQNITQMLLETPLALKVKRKLYFIEACEHI